MNWLTDALSMVNDDKVYLLPTARNNIEVHELSPDNWLVLNWDNEKFWLRFAVLQLSYTEKEEQYCTLVFHGEGPTGNLRECRHTWWGEEGYVFYPPGPVIAAAFTFLGRYYDFT